MDTVLFRVETGHLHLISQPITCSLWIPCVNYYPLKWEACKFKYNNEADQNVHLQKLTLEELKSTNWLKNDWNGYNNHQNY